jgi:hypothetical protein
MAMTERMAIFKLLYVERLKPSAIAAALNREPWAQAAFGKHRDCRIFLPPAFAVGKRDV